MTNAEKAAAVGEYVVDAIAVYLDGTWPDNYTACYQNPRGDLLPPVTLDEIYRATRIAVGHAIESIEVNHE